MVSLAHAVCSPQCLIGWNDFGGGACGEWSRLHRQRSLGPRVRSSGGTNPRSTTSAWSPATTPGVLSSTCAASRQPGGGPEPVRLESGPVLGLGGRRLTTHSFVSVCQTLVCLPPGRSCPVLGICSADPMGCCRRATELGSSADQLLDRHPAVDLWFRHGLCHGGSKR